MPKVSIIVPIYNVEPYLCRCVDSILNQTFTDFECILVDDGSPDKCGEICDEYAKKDKRIRVIHKKNGGLSDARNAGLDIAEGDFIGFVDSDDWIHPQMYEILYRMLVKKESDIAVAKLISASSKVTYTSNMNIDDVVNKAEVVNSKVIYDHYFSEFLEKYWVSVCCKLYKKKTYQNVWFEKGRMYEDVLVAIPALLNSYRVSFTAEKLYFYDDSTESIVRSGFNPRNFDILYVTKKRCEYFKDNKDEYNLGMTVWYYCYLEFVIFTKLYAPQYISYLKPYRKEMIKDMSCFLHNNHVCRLYKLTVLISFFSPKVSEKICKKYFQNVIFTVNGFRKRLK